MEKHRKGGVQQRRKVWGSIEREEELEYRKRGGPVEGGVSGGITERGRSGGTEREEEGVGRQEKKRV